MQNTNNLQAYNRYSYVLNNPLSKVDPTGFMETTITEEQARKLKDSAARINETVNRAVNQVFDQLEKGKIKPEEAAGRLHDILQKGSDKYGNHTALSRTVERQGKGFVQPGGRTEGTKYQGGLPIGAGAKAEANRMVPVGSLGEKLLQALFAHKNSEAVVVWDDNVAISAGINIGGHAVGTDKLDHMVADGYNLFRAGFNAAEARAQSERDERGISGLATTGVYSRGDIEANMIGFDLYSRVDQTARSGGERPVFNINSYDTAKLDENINPNSYTPEVQAIVDKNTRQ